jgi:hypothetical protein
MQLLPNGNALVNWGSEGAITEFKSDGTPIFHAYLDSGYLGIGVENYRGFRSNWTGIPHEAPAIVALRDEQASTTHIYVSWNGDTRTKTWRFYELTGRGRRSLLGEAERKGFETVLEIDRAEIGSVVAEALDAQRIVLVDTSAVKPEVLIHEYKGRHKKPEKQKGSGLVSWLLFEGQRLFGNGEL